MHVTPSTSRSSRIAPAASQVLSPRALATAICGVLGLLGPSLTLAATASSIKPDGRTLTTVTPQAGPAGAQVFSVTTKTVSGTTGFNSFTNFNLVKGDTVNLTLPAATTNLVNLVSNAAFIDGTVNSYLSGSSSKIAGSVYFADPNGIVVGSNGVLNVGALSLSAPSSAFMTTLMDGQGKVAQDSLTLLLTGQEALAAGSKISVQGRINANNAVRLHATAIDVSNTIYVAGTGADSLSTAVNVEGSSTPIIIADGNTIRLIADDSDVAGALTNLTTSSKAAAQITVSGTLATSSVGGTASTSGTAAATPGEQSSWGAIDITATAKAVSAYTTATQALSTDTAGNLLKDQADFSKNGMLSQIEDASLTTASAIAANEGAGQLAYVKASATATVAISGHINASGNVLLSSSTNTEASTAATTVSGSKLPVSVTGMYGGLFSSASTDIASGATVTGGGSLRVNSSTDNTLNVAASTSATAQSNTVATTVAWSQAAVNAQATIEGRVTAQSLALGAHNSNSFSTNANAMTGNTAGGASVGLAGAISLQTVKANAALDVSPTITMGSTGDVTIAAETDNSKNATTAATSSAAPTSDGTAAGAPPASAGPTSGNSADLTSALTDKSATGTSGKALPFKLGAAVAWTDSSSTADATIGSGVTITTAGNVAVNATVSDAGIHNAATSSTASKAPASKTDSGAAPDASGDVNLSAAVAFANYTHAANATIGTNDIISAANIGVGSQVLVPFDWTFGLGTSVGAPVTGMGDSLTDFIKGAGVLSKAPATGPKAISDNASGYASASAGGTGTSVGIGGAVNYFAMNDSTHAWVGDNSSLTSTSAKITGTDSWNTALDWGNTLSWNHSISVLADTEVAAFNLVGDVKIWSTSANGSGTTAAIGGAFNYGGFDNSTIAGIGAGAALVSNNDVAVNAKGKDTLFVVSPISGGSKAGTGSIQGAVAISDLSDTTHATVSADATVAANALNLQATNPLTVWALAGAVALSNQASVGISVGVNSAHTDTLASIGDNRADALAVTGTAAAGAAQTGGKISVSQLGVRGSSSGEVGSVTVAGASVSAPAAAAPSAPTTSSSGSGSGSSGGSSGSSSSTDSDGVTGFLTQVSSVSKSGTTSSTSTAGGTGGLQNNLGQVDELTGANDSGGGSNGSSTQLDKADSELKTVSSGDHDATLKTVTDKAASAEGKSSPGSSSASGTTGGKFGIAISGAASVNMVALRSSAELNGATIDNGSGSTSVAVQGVNNAQLTSVAGAAALQRAGGSGGALAGAVAYSSVADSTTATIRNSTLTKAPKVAVQALDGSEQTDVGVGVAVQTGSNGSAATLAGSVSVGQSSSHTTATISNSSLDGGSAAGSTLEVDAYDHSKIGIGAGSLYIKTGDGTSVNGALGFTYADIGNTTKASINGNGANATNQFDINDYDSLVMRALDSSQIAAGAASGGVSTSTSGLSLAGAFIWNNVANSTTAVLDGGVRLNILGNVDVEASAVAASSVAALNALIAAPTDSSGYDFSGSSLNAAGAPAPSLGSSIIAVAGDLQFGKSNSVGLSFVGSTVSNTHSIMVDAATLVATGNISLTAADNTRIESLAVGLAGSKSQFTGLGSVTYNNITNQDSVLFGSAVTGGSAARISAAKIDAEASDASAIASLAGNLAISSGNAGGGAVTYNKIGNTVTTHAADTTFTATGGGNLTLAANENATIKAGAVAGAATQGSSLALSFGWNQTTDTTNATLDGGGLTTSAGSLSVTAGNASDIQALSGTLAVGGGAAGVGLSASIADIGDVTSAAVNNAVLDVSNSTAVTATSNANIYALSVGGAGAADVAISGANTTNLIHTSISASMSDVGTTDGAVAGAAVASADTNSTAITASNNATINSLAGALSGSGGVAVGAAVAVNQISTTSDASFVGGIDSRTFKAAQLLVSAGAGNQTTGSGGIAASTANINTIAVGAAGGGNVGVAGSVAVNLLTGGTDARIDQSANVIVSGNAGVLASNEQGINVLAGSVAVGGSVGVGVGVVVNRVDASTNAGIYASDVTAYGNGNALSVNSGTAAAGTTLDSNIKSPSAVSSANLSSNQTLVHGVAVNASNEQRIATLAVGASVAGSVAVNALAAVNQVGGATSSEIEGARINQADFVAADTTSGGIESPRYYANANIDQTVDVRTSSRQYEASVVANIAGAGAVAVDGATATNIFDASTKASAQNATISSQGATTVSATGNQWSLAAATGAAAAGSVGGAASASVALFSADTEATVDGGRFDVGSFSVLADNTTRGEQLAGAIGLGGVAGLAGAAIVNVDGDKTSATVLDGAQISTSGNATVQATSSNVQEGLTVVGAAGVYAGIGGAAVVNVMANSTHASVDSSTLKAAAIAVNATDSQSLNAYSGVFGGGFVGFGGGINLSLLQTSVGAGVLNSTLDATNGGVSVDASSSRRVTSVAASAGAGLVAVGLSAGVIIAGSGNSQADLTASGQTNLGNLSTLSGDSNRVDGSELSKTSLGNSQLGANGAQQIGQINASGSYALGAATGGPTAASFGASDGINALVSGGSVNAAQGVAVTANVANSTSNTAGALAAGAAAAGASLAYTALDSDIHASVASGTAITAGNGVTVAATSGDGSNGAAAFTHAISGVGGAVALSAAVSISDVNNTVTASDSGTLNAGTSGTGTLAVSATDSSSSSAGNDNPNVLVGGVVAGAVVVQALRSSTVSASIAGGTTTAGFDRINVTAADTGSSSAQAQMGAGGVAVALGAVVATASDTSNVTAEIGSGANVSTAGINAGTSIFASATPSVTASAAGMVVSGGIGIGGNVANADVKATVNAQVGDGAIFHSGDLSVVAGIAPTASASATGGAGGALLGANAAYASATDESTVSAKMGNDVTLPSGNVTIDATSVTLQTSNAQSITAGGILAAGAADAESISSITTTATLGNGNDTQQATIGNLAIAATGQDTNDANSKAGSGGLIAGNATLATTRSTSNTTATVGQHLNLDQLANFALIATQVSRYGGQANSTNAAAVGASGAFVDNSATSITLTKIGDNSTVATQGALYVQAQSAFSSDGNNAGSSGGAGGIIAGQMTGVNTTLTATNTTTVGPTVNLAAGLNPTNTALGNLTLLADTTTSQLHNPLVQGVFDQASLSVYGAVPIAAAVTNLTGTFTSTVNVADSTALDKSHLSSNGRLDIATYANLQNIGSSASANTGGVATVGTADATINLTSNQSVSVGSNVVMSSVGEADIVAGKDILNSADTELNASAVAQAYIRGLIAIPHASATANTASNATLLLGKDSQITSGSDVAVGSMSGSTLVQTDGTGHGYELGFIPVTQQSNSQNSAASASTTLDGSVLAGKFNTIAINIDANGNLTDGGSSSPYQHVKYNADGSNAEGAAGVVFDPTAYLNKWYQPATPATYKGFDAANVGAYIFGGTLAQRNGITYGTPLYVSGGNVYLYGASISGHGLGVVTANGAPSITINNASSDYLILPGMQVGFGSSGSVIVAGGADPNHLVGITVKQTPSSVPSSITINASLAPGAATPGAATPGAATPGIVLLGEVDNLGGTVSITDAAGSLIESPINANAVTVHVPNGGVVFNQPSQNWTSNNNSQSLLDPGSWLSSFFNTFVSSPDLTAAAIANAVYGNGATDTGSLNRSLLNYNNSPNPSNGQSIAQKTPVVLYGYCAAYSRGGADGCGGITLANGFNPGTTGILDDASVDAVPYIALSQSGKFPANTAPPSGAFTTQKLSVTADFININSPIYVGTPATWTVQTTPALVTWLRQQGGNLAILIPVVDANGNALLSVLNANSQLIGASYNPSTGQIVLNNVNASGGGEAYFDGQIVSTGNGSIHVNSGAGQVVVNNSTGYALQVNNVYTGTGGVGLITLTDTLHTLPGAQPRITWYVSNGGGAAVEYDNSNGGKTYQTGVQESSVSNYQPLAGEEYTWSATTDVNRAGGSATWSWGAAGAGGAGQHWVLGAPNFVGPGDTTNGWANLRVKDASGNYVYNDYNVRLTGSFTDPTIYRVWYHGCDGGDGSGCHYGTTGTGYSSDQASEHSEWDYLYPTAGALNLAFTQRADMPITVAFATPTGTSGSVNIASNANILLNGVISNTKGSTVLESSTGSILQNSASALVWTHDLNMIAIDGSIGSAAAPIQTRIVHDAPANTTQAGINASTQASPLTLAANGGVYVTVDSGNSDQAIFALAQNDISLRSTGSIVGIAGNSGRLDVISGGSINLVSTLGSIGSIGTPLQIEMKPSTLYNGTLGNNSLSAHASGDIALDDVRLDGNGQQTPGGDVWVGSIVSDHGDVALTAHDGGIYDSRGLLPASTLTAAQASAVAARLGLTTSASADSIANTLQNEVNGAYLDYWQLLASGTVSTGTFTLNTNAMALYQPLAQLSAAQLPSGLAGDPLTQAYVTARYNSDTALFNAYLGNDWRSNAAFTHGQQVFIANKQSAFSYVVDRTAASFLTLLSDTQWTTDQLNTAINVAALDAPSGTQVGTATPNIRGRNITLLADQGGIGRTAQPVTINYADIQSLYVGGTASTALKDDLQVLGMANTPGDVVLLGAGGNVLQTGDTNMTADLKTISVAQTNPLYLTATGAVSGSASASVYVQANGDLRLAGLTSGTDMRLTASGKIDAATGQPVNQAALTSSGDLVINAGGGSISFGDGTSITHTDGTITTNPGDALSVQIGGTLLNSSASTDLLLRQLSGDLRVGRSFANGLLSLDATSGSILATLPGISVEGNTIDLAAAGDIGRRTLGQSNGVDAPLMVQVGSSGVLNATATGAVNLDSPVTALQIGSIHSGLDLSVVAAQAALTAQQLISDQGAVTAAAGTDGTIVNVQAATAATLTAAGRLDAGTVDSSAGDITLDAATGMRLQTANAGTGSVLVSLVGNVAPVFVLDANGKVLAGSTISLASSGSLLMEQGSQMAAAGPVTLRSSGDMQLGLVQSLAATGSAITLNAGAAISGNGAALNLQARSGGTTTLVSVNDIGAAASPIVVDVAALSGTSTTGNVWLHALGDIAISSFTTPMGNLNINGDQALTYTTLMSKGSSTLAAAQIDGGMLRAGTSAQLVASGAATVASVETGTDLTIAAGTTLDAASLYAGNSATLTSGAAMTLGSTTAVGDIHATAGTELTSATLNSATGNATLTATMGDLAVTGSLGTALDATLAAGGNTTVSAITAGGALQSNSGGDTHIVQGAVGGTSALTAGGMLTVDALQAANAVTTQSGGDTGLGAVVLSAGSYLGNANGAFSVTQLNVRDGSATLTSGADMRLADVATSGDLRASAGANLAATTLDLGGNAVLTSAQAMALDSITAVGNIAATAGTDLSSVTLRSTSGNATLTATTGNLGITGSLSTALNATLASAGTTSVSAVTAGGTLQSTSAGDTHIAQGNVTGTSALTAGGMLTVDALQAANAVTTQSGGDTGLGSVVLSAGSYLGHANAAFNVTRLNVHDGSATLTSGADMRLFNVATSGDLSAKTGANLTATALNVGGNATLTSAQAMRLDSTAAGGYLLAAAGGALSANTSNVSADATLTSGQSIALDSTTVGGNLEANAGSDLSAVTSTIAGNTAMTALHGNIEVAGSLTSGGDASLSSGKDTTVAVLTAGGNFSSISGADTHLLQGVVTGATAVTAGGTLLIDSLRDGSKVTTQSAGTTTLAQVLLTDGSFTGTANGDFNVIQSLNVQQGNATIHANRDSGLALVTTAGTLIAQAGGNLQSNVLQIGTSGQLAAGGNIALLGATTAGTNLDMVAVDHLGFAGIDAGQNVFGQSLTGGIDGDSVVAGSSMRFLAAAAIHLGRARAGVDVDLQAGTDVATQTVIAGRDVNVVAGTDVSMFTTKAGNALNVDAGGALTVHDMEAGHTIGLAAQQITFASLTAPDSITLLARDGNIVGTALATRDAFASANGDVTLDAASIGDRINLAANDITAQLMQTSKGQPLYSVLSGYRGGVARLITVDADASQQWMIDRLSALQAALATTAPRADIQSGHIEQTMSLDTSMATVRMNEQQAYLVPADVQLMQPKDDFVLYQDGIHTLTDAFVIHYNYGFQIQTPDFVNSHLWLAPDYLGESAVRYDGRLLTQQFMSDADPSERRAVPAWISNDNNALVRPVDDGPAVNLKSPGAPE